MRAVTLPPLFVPGAALILFGLAACEEPTQQLPSTENLPQQSARRRGPPAPEIQGAGAAPGRARIVRAPSDNIVLQNYRGGGGGGGGGRSVTRPVGFPRGRHQEPEDFHAAARDVGERPIPRGSEACDLAFQAMVDLQRARRAKTPGRRRGDLNRENYVSACELRPEIEQWCLVPSFVRENAEECDRRAHTRYQSAVARLERQQNGEAVDWAPAGDPPDEGDGTAEGQAIPMPTPTMGPVRVTP